MFLNNFKKQLEGYEDQILLKCESTLDEIIKTNPLMISNPMPAVAIYVYSGST
jgi:hypothetical protein